ncbi:hypothetical protein BSKO_06574 [Bryopsis sp. KO-2023]|nr:hypothetical protein BSKO_06574 [Bryopsis sp. KO-2023]
MMRQTRAAARRAAAEQDKAAEGGTQSDDEKNGSPAVVEDGKKVGKGSQKAEAGEGGEVSPGVKDDAQGKDGKKATQKTTKKRGKKAQEPREVDDALRKKASKISEQLAEFYPAPEVPLDNENHFQLLVAVMLSARTTDKQVNAISPKLFEVAPDALAMSKLEVSEILELIKKIGLAPTKAKNLKALSQILVDKYDGTVPDTFEDLESLPGIGHKTASVVMIQGFGTPAFPVDTHIHRLAKRWGLSDGKNVEKTEADLKAIYPDDTWGALHLQIIYFGREHCPALGHDQLECPICSWAASKEDLDKARASAKAKKAASPKRKRKQAAAEEEDSDSQKGSSDQEGDQEEESKPKKRGRKKNPTKQETAAAKKKEENAGEPKKTRGRGRPRKQT